MDPKLIECCGERLWLSPSKCIFWEGQRTLILADLHIGKSAHFRKAGIAIPQQVFQEDLQRLFHQIHFFNPNRIIIAGDLFHSHENREHEWFSKWKESIVSKQVILVKGNHEILHNVAYEKLGLTIAEEHYEQGPFAFAHILPVKQKSGLYYFSGHIHPGIKLFGKGKQSFTFPCFHFTETCCTLPAFSKFTGMGVINPRKEDRVFAVVADKHTSAKQPYIHEL